MARTFAMAVPALLCLLGEQTRCPAADLVVSLTVQAKIQANSRVIVTGETNLPPHTTLMIHVEDAVSGEMLGQTKTEVLANGTYTSEEFGSRAGLKDGRYVASVTMPIARVQPDNVRRIIGEDGQNLKGPLVEKGNLVSVNAKETFTIGKDAVRAQLARLQNDIDLYRGLTKEITALFAQLEKTKKRNLLQNEENLENLREWGVFARKFSSDHVALQKRIDAVGNVQAGLLGMALGEVDSMFHTAAFQKDGDYRERKIFYLESLRELQAFIRELESAVSKAAPNSGLAAAFREWSDVTGKFRVDARLISVTGAAIQLEKRDGSKLTIPLEKLSREDQAYVQSQNR